MFVEEWKIENIFPLDLKSFLSEKEKNQKSDERKFPTHRQNHAARMENK